MINWLFDLNNFKKKVQSDYHYCLRDFLIKEDDDYLKYFLNESKDDQETIDELYFWTKLSLWRLRNSFDYQLDQLLHELNKSRLILKKCLLCECEIETLDANWSVEISSLKASRLKLFKDLGNYFKKMRVHCKSIRDSCDKIDETFFSGNQISELPIDTFDNIIEVDEFNYVKLKSLIQLIRLEISELLTTIIFKYSTDKPDLFVNLECIKSSITKLNDELKTCNKEISQSCNYFNVFFSRNQQDNNSRNQINTQQNENLFNLKQSRTKIYSSLLMIDNYLDSILEDKTKELNNDYIVSELTSAIDALKLISSKTSKAKKSEFVAKEVDKLNSNLNSEHTSAKEVCLNEEIPEYEVFEAYIEDDKMEKYANDFEENVCKKNKYPDTLYGELKEALDVKAKSHRTREAKALGVDEDSIKLPNLSQEIQRSNIKERYHNVLTNPPPQVPFSLNQLAGEKVPKRKVPKFLSNEENFGDDLSEDE